jgi:hypothetical protein
MPEMRTPKEGKSTKGEVMTRTHNVIVKCDICGKKETPGRRAVDPDGWFHVERHDRLEWNLCSIECLGKLGDELRAAQKQGPRVTTCDEYPWRKENL